MSAIAPLISDLAIILVAAGCSTLVFKGLRQPVILGYIVAGVLAGPSVSFIPTVSDASSIRVWADIGVIFLLFAMGLEFSFRKLLSVGGTAVTAAVTIVAGMMFVGYGTGMSLGFSHMSSIFLGGMLSMSSTAIVFKAFDDMGLRGQRFTGVVLGILVVEDLVGVVLMVLLSTLAVSKQFEGAEMLGSILKLGAFLIFWSLLGIYLIPTLLKRLQRLLNDETLLIVTLGLCLGMVMIAVKAGFSAALGAFVMGSLLAETVAAERITRLVEPVKNLFGAIFFVSVGMMIEPALLVRYAGPIVLLTVVVLAGQATFATLGVLAPMLETMTVRAADMRRAADGGYINATDCADYLAKKGLPFRDAYKVTGALVAYAIDAGKTLAELPLDEYRRFSPLFDADVYEALDMHTCMALRNSQGGTAPARVAEQIKKIEEQLS